MLKKSPFIVRVYGIYIDPQERVLVSDEFIYGSAVTKFPGGGLEFGEGTLDCLIREMMEETGHSFEILGHFYTTDFFVPSIYNPDLQVVSVYYKMQPAETFTLRTSEFPFDYGQPFEGAQSFRWIPLERISSSDFTLAIDQRVAELLKASR